MTIVAVNGGGNTPKGEYDGDVDGRDFLAWQRGNAPLETGAFEIKDFSFGVENPTTIGGDTFGFKPELTSEPTAPEPYMQWKLNNAIVTNYQIGSGGDLLMSDVISFEIDPTNPNVDLLATPGPDDNVGLPAADGLLLPY